MKTWLSLWLSATLALPAAAAPATSDANDPLMVALVDLNQKVVHVDESRSAKLKTYGWNLMTYMVYIAGSIAILNPTFEAQVLAAVTRPPSDPMRAQAIQAERLARAMGDDMYHYYFSAAQRNMFAITGILATVGGVMWVVGYLSKWSTRHRAQPPEYYRSPETMKQFFELDIKDQYELAHGDPEFKRYVFDLHDAYLLIENGYPRMGGPTP